MINSLYSVFLTVLLAASLCDLLIPIIIGFGYPGYNHLLQSISTLGTKTSPVRKFQNANLILVGTLFLVFTIGQHSMFVSESRLHNLYSAGIILFGLGCIIAAVFPEDTKGSPETVSGKVHGIASGIGFIMLSLNPLWAVWINEFRPFITVNIILFISGTISFSLFMASENKTSGILKYTGLFQRINLAALYGTLVLNYSLLAQ